jgi:hypothetical protein
MPDLDKNGVFVPVASTTGRGGMVYDYATQKWHPISGDASGKVDVNAVVAPPTVPTDLQSTLVPVAIGGTAPLTVPVANTQRQIIQNRQKNPVSLILIREAGGVAGTGAALGPFASVTFITTKALEVEHLFGPAATVSVQFEVT